MQFLYFSSLVILDVLLTNYAKGARCERELIKILESNGYHVMRAAGSGVSSSSPPDIIAIKDGKGVIFECKAWEKSSLAFEKDKINMLTEWERNTQMQLFFAWRMNGKGWYFVKQQELRETEMSFVVTKRRAMEINRNIHQILSLTNNPQTVAPVLLPSTII